MAVDSQLFIDIYLGIGDVLFEILEQLMRSLGSVARGLREMVTVRVCGQERRIRNAGPLNSDGRCQGSIKQSTLCKAFKRRRILQEVAVVPREVRGSPSVSDVDRLSLPK